MNLSKELVIKTQQTNLATKFFKIIDLDCSTIDVTSPQQILELIKNNLPYIARTLFNLINNGRSVFEGENQQNIKTVMGEESMRILQDNFIKFRVSVSETCKFIKIDNADPKEVFDLLGITYFHGNLPPECDDLF